METKVCNKCKVEKPLSKEYFYFRKDKNRWRGDCIECCSEANRKYRENPTNRVKLIEYNKEYRQTPEYKEMDKLRRSTPEYKESQKKSSTKYYSNPINVQKKKKSKKQWYSKIENKERRNKNSKERYNTDPEYRFTCSIMGHIRGVEKRDEFRKEWDEVKDLYDMYGIQYHIDHRIPKNWFKSSTPKGIVNDIRNLQVIDATYNVSKKDRWADPVCLEYLEIAKPYIKKDFLVKLT